MDTHPNETAVIPAGFTPVTAAALGITLAADETFAAGLYTRGPDAALVTTGTLNGVTTLVLAFRDVDVPGDKVSDLRAVGQVYTQYARIVAAVDAFVSQQGIGSVIVTGHDRESALTQLYLLGHPDTATTHYSATTGTIQSTAAAASITPTTTGVQVFRFFDTHSGTQFLTASVSERDQAIATRPDLVYEGFALNADASATAANSTAVYRFFDLRTGSHFYTADTNERNGLVSNTASGLAYEGVAFYEKATAGSNDAAVYRFFNKEDGTHFFTANQTEATTISSTRNDLVSEGIAFYTARS